MASRTLAAIGHLIRNARQGGTRFAMAGGMRRVFGDTMTTIGGLLLVLGLLVAFDDRVRDSMWGLTGAHRSAAEITSAGERARDVLVTVMQVARDQSLDHAPLMIFTLAAMVLVLFMLRT